MIESKCPECGTPGKKGSWKSLGNGLTEYSFSCNNGSCRRSRKPWSVFVRGST